MKKAVKRLLLGMITLAMVEGYAAPGAHAISAASHYVLLYIDQQQAFVGKQEVTLDVAPTIIDGKTYVPARFLAETLGFPVEWNEQTRSITLSPMKHRIVINIDELTMWQDEVRVPFDSTVKIINGSLLVQLTWLADMTDCTYIYNEELSRIEMLVVKTPNGIPVTALKNSKPVAKFGISKKTYRPGETVKYTDLSYDIDAESIVDAKWTGNKETFFKAGKYPVTLQVTDEHGNKSDVYKDYVTVSGSAYLSEFDYPIYNKPIGSYIKTGWSGFYAHFDKIPEIGKTATYDEERVLLVSDSPEEIMEAGVLYRDTINGKGRLYGHHINLSGKNMTFSIYARNLSDKPVKIITTNKGEVWPSIYANLIGSEATTDFLLKRDIHEELVVPPGKTYTYSQMPTFLAGQGANVIYDVESDGPIEFSFTAQDTNAIVPLNKLKTLMNEEHVRGTYPSSNVSWDLDMNRKMEEPVKLQIGNGKSDPFLQGKDGVNGKARENFGNWGVEYDIHIKNPPKMAVMFLGKGGYFKGPVKVNGEIVLVPQSGVLTAFEGVILLGRTTGTEATLDIEFTPPGGSNMPVDIIFYPLNDLK